jgi:hypothetical protein
MRARRRWEPDSIVPDLIDRTATERNRILDEVKALETNLDEKRRYLRELENTLKALKGTGRDR